MSTAHIMAAAVRYFKMANILMLLLSVFLLFVQPSPMMNECAPSCPDNFVCLNDCCYYFSNSSTTWYSAWEKCSSLSAHLATVTDSNESNQIKQYLQSNFPNVSGVDGWWIGASDATLEGEWVWMSSLAVVDFTDWGASLPDNNGGENCLSLYPHDTFQWNDRSCDFWGFRYVCELYPGDRQFQLLGSRSL